jgi:solute carrier family 35, member E3
VSIASLNLSLLINSVGFYQIAKLLIIPFTAVVEAVWLRDLLSTPQTISTATVLAGVAIVYAPAAGLVLCTCGHVFGPAV